MIHDPMIDQVRYIGPKDKHQSSDKSEALLEEYRNGELEIVRTCLKVVLNLNS